MKKKICKKFSGVERGAERQMRLFTACGSAELEEIAFGFATQGLWLEDRKVGSQVVGEDQSRLSGRRTVGKVRRKRR